jgi:hypothetical protein
MCCIQGGEDVATGLPGCDIMLSCRCLLTFRNNMLSLFPGLYVPQKRMCRHNPEDGRRHERIILKWFLKKQVEDWMRLPQQRVLVKQY